METARRVYDGFFKVDLVDTPQGERKIVRATNSVALLLFNISTNCVLLIRESRASMITDENPTGLTVGTVAGRFDVELDPKALAVKEAKEEAGVTLKESDIEILNNGQPLAVNAGMTNEKCYLAFATIGWSNYDTSHESFGNSQEGEVTERVWMPAWKFIDYRFYRPECLTTFALKEWFMRTSYSKR